MLRSIKIFFSSNIAVGIGLMIATSLAMLLANSANFTAYQNFFATALPLKIKWLGIAKDLTLRDWINDFLMAIFFLLIGLELKREILVGELSSKEKIILPTIAACGGVVLPIAIFLFFNRNHPENLRGFAIPSATDIAFAYGIISLFGKRFSNSLKVFLVTLAVIDDLIAIVIIAIFYSEDFNSAYLALAAIALVGLGLLNFFKSPKIHLYLLFGGFLWLMILKSGLHPTLAGVALAFFIPLNIGNYSPLSRLAHKISPTVNFVILPAFALANSGVNLENFSLASLTNPMAGGIICGLFFGKQLGVMLFSFIAIKLNLTHLPRTTNWLEFYIASILTGLGFTMSLFIGSLAFIGNDSAFNEVKIGVICGSILSIIFASALTLLFKKE